MSETPAAVPDSLARVWLPALYFTSFAVLGGVVPYLALELRERGMSGGTLALALGALPLGRLLFGPVGSLLADKTQSAGRVLQLGAVISLVGLAMLGGATGWLAVLAVFILAIGRAPLGPVVDALTMSTLGGDRGRYGRVRRWGSFGFLVATLAAGALRDGAGVSPLWFGVGLGGLVVAITLALPGSGDVAAVDLGPALRALLKDRFLLWLLPSAALHFAAHVGSTSFLAVHLDALGHPSAWAGVALAVGVTVEIVVMSQARAIFSRFSAEHVLLASVALAVPRWLVTAWVTDPLVLVALQALHGVTFGAFWLAGIGMIAERAPERVQASAQALFAAAIGGVGAMLGMVGAGLLVDRWPTRTLFDAGAVLAALAFVGMVFAVRAGRSR